MPIIIKYYFFNYHYCAWDVYANTKRSVSSAISIVINFKKTETSKQSSPDTYEIGDGLGIP